MSARSLGPLARALRARLRRAAVAERVAADVEMLDEGDALDLAAEAADLLQPTVSTRGLRAAEEA